MKKTLLFILMFLFSIYPVISQERNDSPDNDFQSFLNTGFQQVSKCFEEKDYQCAKDNLLNIETKYYQQDKSQQKESVDILQHIYYNLACAYSMLGDKNEAVSAYEKAIKKGYNNYIHAKNDSDLDNIRDLPEFKKLQTSIREKGDYTYILQKSGPYTQEPPVFTYQSPDDQALSELKEYFNLDSISGNGDEISRVMNIMTWTHNLIKHDGSFMPPTEKRTAISFYKYAKEHDKGINCRALAIFLNECYLAMGFKSRFITCLPKNENDSDCHVINMVYSETLNKWVWVDPTFNTWVKDENGNMLGIGEVRKRLIENRPVFINDDANWNNKIKYTKEMYIDSYMAKNLYWFSCTASSSVDSDMIREYNCKIALVPHNYYQKNRDSLTYYSHDDDYFWENNR